MQSAPDLWEEDALLEQVRCRSTAQRCKPPQRYSSRFEKQRRPAASASGIQRRGNKRHGINFR